MTSKGQLVRAPGTGEITRILLKMREGDPEATEELLSHVYHELRRLAACKLAGELPGQTLQPTALVHEAWLRLAGVDGQGFADRAYFFAAASRRLERAMRFFTSQPSRACGARSRYFVQATIASSCRPARA